MYNLLKKIEMKEILKFLVGGGSAVIVDFILYFFLKSIFLTSVAKAISFICGAFVGFVINKLWTFESKEFNYHEIMKYVVLYAFSATVNAIVNKSVLYFTSTILLAFFIATGCSTIINFLGQKFFVFRKGVK